MAAQAISRRQEVGKRLLYGYWKNKNFRESLLTLKNNQGENSS